MKPFKEPIYVTESFLPPYEEYTACIKKIWDTHWMTNNGELHNSLQVELANYLQVDNVTLFVNGHLALDVAIKSLNLTGEVITTPFTFASTTHAIVMNGCTPVFCDINMNDFTIDVDKIEGLITDKTTAIVAVHVYGYPCNVGRIEQIAQKYNLKVIYDAAHAFGVEIEGTGIGTFGDVSMMSFHATKVFNTIEGGALLYNNKDYERQFNLYKNFGITGPENVEAVGLNAKMNEFQAAMGLVNLKYVDGQIEKRKNITELYRKGLREVKGINLMKDEESVKHNYAYFPILIDEKEYGMTRDELVERLKEYNVFARKYFYPLTADYECFGDKYKSCDLKNARYIAERILTLPIFGELGKNMVQDIVYIIREVVGDSE